MQNIVSPKPVADESDFIDKLVWFIWLGAIATIIYAYIFGTTTYGLSKAGIEVNKDIDLETGSYAVNVGNQVAFIISMVFIYYVMSKSYLAYKYNNMKKDALHTNLSTIITVTVSLILCVGSILLSMRTDWHWSDLSKSSSEKKLDKSGPLVWGKQTPVISLLLLTSIFLFVLTSYNVWRRSPGNKPPSHWSYYYYYEVLLIFLPLILSWVYVAATNFEWLTRGTIAISTILATCFLVYNIFWLWYRKQDLPNWNTVLYNIWILSPIYLYYAYVKNTNLFDISKKVLYYILLIYLAIIGIFIFKYNKPVKLCKEEDWTSCFNLNNISNISHVATFNWLFVCLIISSCINIINFIIQFFSGGIGEGKLETFLKLILFPFYWLVTTVMQNPLTIILLFIFISFVAVWINKNNFDLKQFIIDQKGFAIMSVTILLGLIVMFGIGLKNNNPTSTLEFIKKPLLLFAAITVVIGILIYLLTSKSKLIDVATVLQYFIYALIFMGMIAVIIVSIRTIFSNSRKMGDTMFQTSENSNWVTNILKLIGNALIYIPCLLIDFVEMIKEQYKITTSSMILILVLQILFIIFGYALPILFSKAINHLGVQVLSFPKTLKTETTLDSSIIFIDPVFTNDDVTVNENKDDKKTCEEKNPKKDNEELDKTVERLEQIKECMNEKKETRNRDKIAKQKTSDRIAEWFKSEPSNKTIQLHRYNWGISMWFYIRSSGSNATANVFSLEGQNQNKVVTVLYDNNTNAISVNGDTLTGVHLHKWNNLVINFDKGKIDVFINGKLLSTSNDARTESNNIALNMKIGNESIRGEICNIIIHKENFTKSQINWIYDSNKLFNPPVVGINFSENDSTTPKLSGMYIGMIFGILIGAILGCIFNAMVDKFYGAIMGAILFGAIGAVLGYLFWWEDGIFANVFNAVADVFVNTF